MHKPAESFAVGAIDFTGGSLGGVALVYVSQPLDTVKVKMQTFPHLYKGMMDCLVKTYRNDGFARGLYAGTIPAVVANVAENSVLFAAYGGCQSLMAKIEGKAEVNDLSPLSNATAGFLAAFFSSFTLCPTELIKCKLQALREVQTGTTETKNSTVNRISPFKLTHSIIREEGIRGLYRGLTSTIAREMPGYFFFFGGYEATRELLRKPGQTKNDIGPINTMISGAVGGVVLWAVIFPADVIKSRIQIYNLPGGLLSVGSDILRKEGPLALYNGLKPTLIRTIPATAVLFVVFEYTKKILTDIFIT
ncbi:mitochondrial ornithine transporter 1-like [Bradysia coprophila]|uniref:mitochondrial ornithine transporter 1-like n=1 Tax=Bradysia coprophila TaxID=38358 RepID=UPI00187D895B|nr:mitochondrial ornithine transporter 1-like [Bradysia coprophila]